MPLLCFALVSFAIQAAAAFTLSTGELSLSPSFKLNANTGQFPSLHVVDMNPSLLGDAHAAVTALGCASVHSFLPPTALLVHFPTSECLARAMDLPHVTTSTFLPPHLKHHPAVVTPSGEWAVSQGPVRSLRLQVAVGGVEGLVDFLGPQLLTQCPTCTLHAASGDGQHALLTSLSNCPPPSTCTFASPASCGCTIPSSLLHLVTKYHALVFVEPTGAPAQAFNAFQRELTLTSDLLNSPSIVAEFGACAESGSCELSRFIPLSQTSSFLNNVLAALPPDLVRAAVAARAVGGGGATAPAVASFRSKSPRLSDLPSVAGVPFQPSNDGATATASPVVVVAGEMAGIAAQQKDIWGTGPRSGRTPALASTTGRELQGTCTLACSGPSCGQGFATCNDLESYIASTLTGAGQLIHVLDSGLDYGNPFFLDSRPTATTKFQPSRNLPFVISAHSRVASYWSFVDALDDAGGHGTHVAGSVSGAAVDPAITPADASALQTLHGAAPGARIVFTDAACTAPPGVSCPMTGNTVPWSGGFSPCPQPNAICTPLDWNITFGAPRAAGAFVSGNSWGSSSQSEYSSDTSALDAWVYKYPDFLPVFAASNDGDNGYLSLGSEATAKNVLTVGATNDGPISHLAKISQLFQTTSGAGCTTIVSGALQQGLLPGSACPSVLTDDTCSRLADASQRRTFNVPGGWQTRFNTSGNLELPLCCGCTPADVFSGYAARIKGGDGSAQFAFLNTALTYLSTYQGRIRASFSSLGPTQDGRIKPDLAAPGWDIISASGRGSGFTRSTSDPPPYGTFACPLVTTIGATPWPGQSVFVFTSPAAGLNTYLEFSLMEVVEPIRIVNVTLPFQSLTAGTYEINFLSWSSSISAITPLRFTTTTGIPTPGTIIFPNISLEMGAGWDGRVRISATAGSVLTAYSSSSPAFVSTCWGFMDNSLLLTITTARGGGLGYTTTLSGTSMATPHVTGLAGLVRSYYTGGRSTPPGATAGVAFSPSAALIKGTLINSASPLLYGELNKIEPALFPPASAALLQASGGFGVPSLVRGLQFPSLGSATSASRALPTLVLPGLTVPTGTSVGVDPSLANGASHTYCIDVSPPAAGLAVGAQGLPLSLTLVWTDPPGNPLAAWYLVNNLDLSLLPPGGAFTIYGNNNVSSPTQIPDGRNNVEKIELQAPLPSLNADGSRATAPYAVTVRGTSVPLGPQQAYSLVATGPGLALAAAGSCGGGGTPPAPAPAAAASSALPAPAAAAIAVLALVVVALACALGIVLWRQRAAGGAAGGKESSRSQAWVTGGGARMSPVAASEIKVNPVAAFGSGAGESSLPGGTYQGVPERA